MLLSTFLINGCSGLDSQENTDSEITEEASGTSESALMEVELEEELFDEEDLDSSWDESADGIISLEGDIISFEGMGAVVEENIITISSAGTYEISGVLKDGSIVVDTDDKESVRLILNGAQITSSFSAPIYIKAASKTIITLAEGTENTITDGEAYVLEDEAENEPNAAIYSKDDLVINGTGILNVTGNYNNGINGKDDLKIAEGIINVTSVDDGILGKDSIAINKGTITVKAGGDGLKSGNETEENKGYIVIYGGIINITSGNDGIQAATLLQINDGEFNLSSGDGSQDTSESMKGLKAGSEINILGGIYEIVSSDDSVHSNGTITIEGGELSINSGDDGIHSDEKLVINDGTITISRSYEGIESNYIIINGGEVKITASDDGVNVAGGNDGSSVNGRPGQNNFTSSGTSKLEINGGYVWVDSTGDGLDANGSIVMTGGTVLINGPSNSGNGSLDYDGTFELTGGILAAAGSAGMTMTPSDSSSQYSLSMTFSSTQEPGTIVSIVDADQKEIVTFAPGKQFQNIMISSPDLKEGEEYAVYTGGTYTGTSTDGYLTDESYEGGTEIIRFTISSAITYLNEAGVTTGGSQNGQTGQRSSGQGKAGGARPGGFEENPEIETQ